MSEPGRQRGGSDDQAAEPPAAGSRLRADALSEFLDAWEDEHGPLTVDELTTAAAELGRRR